MSMYGMVFGDATFKLPMMRVAELDPDKVAEGRFRDAWFEPHEDGYRLAIYTRVGGNNRESYPEWVEWMQAQPTYLSDEDDSFDNTYATYYFRVTDDGMQAWADWLVSMNLQLLGKDGEPFIPTVEELWAHVRETNPQVIDTGEKWQEVLAGMGKAASDADAG